MALPNPNSLVSVTLTLAIQDLLQNVQAFSRIGPLIASKTVNVQYQGYVNLPLNTNTSFAPIAPVVSFAVVYLRNAGAGNIEVQYANTGGALTNNCNLDPGAVFLYVSPALTSVAVGGISSGIASVTIGTAATTTANVEVLVAG